METEGVLGSIREPWVIYPFERPSLKNPATDVTGVYMHAS